MGDVPWHALLSDPLDRVAPAMPDMKHFLLLLNALLFLLIGRLAANEYFICRVAWMEHPPVIDG